MKNKYEIRGDTVVLFHNRLDGSIVESYIDRDDFDRVDSFQGTWTAAMRETGECYVFGKFPLGNGKRKTILIHRWILDAPDDKMVDHINHETMNNRRSNLRSVSPLINSHNRKGANKDSATGMRGIAWRKKDKQYRVKFMIEGKVRYFGQYNDIEEAKKVAERVIKEMLPA